MSKSYNDPVKSKVREKLRDFIKKHVLAYRMASDVRVACFPGAEQEGEEALEVREIYDPLGIPRKNITGLERDAEKADRLRTANLGIEVICSEASDYFLTTGAKPFEVINLDYTGQLTLDEALTLEYIASRQLLANYGVLATTYYTSRESESMKRLLALRKLNLLEDTNGKWEELKEKNLEEIQRRAISNVETMISSSDREMLRDGITYEIISIMAGGTINRPIIKNMFSDDCFKEKILTAVGNEMNHRPEIYSNMAEINRMSVKRNMELYEDGFILEQAYLRIRSGMLVESLLKIFTREGARALVTSLNYAYQKSYIAKSLERYFYTSNSGSPMIVDFSKFAHLPKRIAMGVSGIVKYEQQGAGSVQINHLGMPLERIINRVAQLTMDFYDFAQVPIPRRIGIKAESTPATVNKTKVSEANNAVVPNENTKNEVRELVKAGFSADEVWKEYKQHFSSRRQFGAVISWASPSLETKMKKD